MNKKRTLQRNIKKENEPKKGKENKIVFNRVRTTDQSIGNRQTFNCATRDKSTTIGRRAHFFRYMVFLRIRPGSRSPSCAWNNCIIPSKHVKTLKQCSSAEISCFTPRDCKRPQWNKHFLNTSIFPRCTESRCTEKNQARSLMTSTHASVRCSILVFTDIHHCWPLFSSNQSFSWCFEEQPCSRTVFKSESKLGRLLEQSLKLTFFHFLSRFWKFTFSFHQSLPANCSCQTVFVGQEATYWCSYKNW